MANQKTGVPTLLKHTKLVCKYIALFGALIKVLTPGNTALHNALDTANSACATLVAELELVRNYGD